MWPIFVHVINGRPLMGLNQGYMKNESRLCCCSQVIFGPMFSGKTTELIRRLKRYQVAKYNCLIVRYAKDDRYSSDGISTHDKQQLPAVSASRLSDLKALAHDRNVIGIDEGQFVSRPLLTHSLLLVLMNQFHSSGLFATLC